MPSFVKINQLFKNFETSRQRGDWKTCLLAFRRVN